MEFSLEQYKEWLEEAFPDNRARAIAEANFREGLAKMADFVFETNSTAFVQASIAHIEGLKTGVDASIQENEQIRDENLQLLSQSQAAQSLTEQYKNETLLIKQSADSNTILARVFQDAVNFGTNTPNLAALALNNTTDKGKFWKVAPNGAGTTNITGTSVTCKEGDEFTWNGTKWVWTANTTTLSVGQVRPINTSFLSVKNLANPAEFVDGGFIHASNGAFNPNPIYGHTGYIAVIPGGTYSGKGNATFTPNNGMRHVAFYNANKVLVAGGLSANTITFTVPAGVYFVIVSYYVADKPTFQFEQSAAPTAYQAYGKSELRDTDVSADSVVQNAGKNFVTDSEKLRIPTAGEKTSWNGKVDGTSVLSNIINSKNLANPAEFVDGYIASGVNGLLTTADAGYGYTGLIPVIPGQWYCGSSHLGTSTTGVMRTHAFYNAAGVFISGDTNSQFRTQAPAGVAFMRATYYLSVKATFMVEQSQVPTVFVPYVAPKKELVSVAGSDVKSNIQFELVGKSKNLANPAGFIDNFYVAGQNGIRTQGVQYGYTEFMPIVPGLSYTGRGASGGMRHVAFFTINKGFLSGLSVNTVSFVAPENAYYAIASYYVVDKATFQFEQSEAATTFVAYNPGVKQLKSVEGAEIPASVSTTSEKLTFENSDKILATGCSYDESAYTHWGKSYFNKLAHFTDWNIANVGVSGQRIIDVADRLRKNTPTYGILPAAFKATYITLANNGNEFFPGSGENLDLYQEQFKIAAEAIHALGAKPIIGTNYHVNNNKWLESSLKAFADANKYPYMGIGLLGEKIISSGYQGFWSGSHPGVRTNAFIWQEWLYFINQLPRPRKGMKIFRPRLDGQTIEQLNYDTIHQRFERFIELNNGERSLNEANDSVSYYDRLNEGTTVDPADENNIITNYNSQLNANEYMALINGTAISFSDWALFELIIDRINVNSFVIKVKGDAGLSFHLKNNNDPSKYESAGRDKELVFQVTEAVYNAFTDAVGTKYTSLGVKAGSVQFAFTGKLKSYAMGKGWFLCFTADADVAQGDRIAATTTITRVSNSVVTATLNQKSPYRYGFSFFDRMKKPKGGWQQLTTEVVYAAGVYTITLPASSAKYFQFDKLKLIAAKAGAFAVTGIEAEYSGGSQKATHVKEVEQKPFGIELVPTRGFTATWNTTDGWTDNGNALVSMPVGVRDYPPYLATNNHLELGFDANGFSRKITRTINLTTGSTARRGWQKLIVRVTARMFPKIYNPAQSGPYFTDTPTVTRKSNDLGMICVGFRAPGSNAPESIIRQPVDIGWSEVVFETTIPIMEGSFIMDIWRDCEVSNHNPDVPMQVYDVSVQTV